MKLVNLQEEIVAQLLDEQLRKATNVCQCERCYHDMLAYALNRLPARYVARSRGFTFSRVEMENHQAKAQAMAAVASAIRVVAYTPNHNCEE